MYTDLFGKTRYKVDLHTHTTLTNGRATPDPCETYIRVEVMDERGKRAWTNIIPISK